jgi:hypothetical protein
MSTSYEISEPTQADYIERWEQALRVLESMTEHEREKHFDMDSWGVQTPCGTVACLAGHCSLDPWFRARGFASNFGQNGTLWFMNQMPSDFFGEVGEAQVFLKMGASYDEVVGLTKDFIRYLKEGGAPNESSDYYRYRGPFGGEE